MEADFGGRCHPCRQEQEDDGRERPQSSHPWNHDYYPAYDRCLPAVGDARYRRWCKGLSRRRCHRDRFPDSRRSAKRATARARTSERGSCTWPMAVMGAARSNHDCGQGQSRKELANNHKNLPTPKGSSTRGPKALNHDLIFTVWWIRGLINRIRREVGAEGP